MLSASVPRRSIRTMFAGQMPGSIARFRQHLGERYNKATDGVRLLRRIAYTPELMERMLNANASLREIVASMVALEE
jgi:hypothetical protein